MYSVDVCPDNMEKASCTCQGSCEYPGSCTNNCTTEKTCICRDGFLMGDNGCVSEKDCGCFVAGYGVIPIFQRRYQKDDRMKFSGGWKAYKRGFKGGRHSGFWLGNEKLHYITNQKNYKLRISLNSTEENAKHIVYSKFRISNESDYYRLASLSPEIGGELDDALSSSKGIQFSAGKHDKDSFETGKCSDKLNGGWWYDESNNKCGGSDLNGKNIRWKNLNNIKNTTMALKPEVSTT
ncbi:Ficolin-1-A [Holothuria leucospilota]|uniref:Ficolin-1-A n=1 Tax=Holothuria leucospilota TaxID=206669 RepID=A0A9Q1BIQ2_HOLLE|nr:Ficolin-1-A [Holothuria leucospilota]